MNLKDFRKQYPQYDDMSDEALSTALHKKYYSDMDYQDFAEKIGMQTEKSYWQETASNVPESAYLAGQDIVHAVTNPAQTVNAMGDIIFGGAEKLANKLGIKKPEDGLSDVGRYSKEAELEKKAEAFGGFYKDRYGSIEQAKETFKNDPIGALLDASLVTTGVGGGVSAIPKMGRVGQATQRVAAAIDPVNMAIAGVKAPYRIAGKVIPESAKQATTGAIKNLLPRHRARSGTALNELAGPQAMDLIKNAEYQRQYVPGNQPTAIQAAIGGGRLGPGGMGPPSPPINRPQFAALDKPFKKRKPSEYGEAMESQRQGRVNAIERGIARSSAEKRAAIKVRSDTTDPMYKAARESNVPVDINPVIQSMDRLIKDNPANDQLVAVLRKLKSNLTYKKPIVNASGQKTGKYKRVARTRPKEIISAFDGIKKSIGDIDNRFIKTELRDIKYQLMEQVPLYKAAEIEYAKLSRPINKMDIGEYIAGRLRKESKSGAEPVTQYFNILDDAKRTIKNSLDEPRYKSLEEILDPQQQQILAQVGNEFKRDQIVNAQISSGYPRMAEVMEAALAPVELPGMLSSKMMITRNILARLKGHSTAKTAKYMADRQLSGPELAAIMREATPKEKAILSSGNADMTRHLITQSLFQSGRQENQ